MAAEGTMAAVGDDGSSGIETEGKRTRVEEGQRRGHGCHPAAPGRLHIHREGPAELLPLMSKVRGSGKHMMGEEGRHDGGGGGEAGRGEILAWQLEVPMCGFGLLEGRKWWTISRERGGRGGLFLPSNNFRDWETFWDSARA
jgi:hypothetical protein